MRIVYLFINILTIMSNIKTTKPKRQMDLSMSYLPDDDTCFVGLFAIYPLQAFQINLN